jgi:hypothetical protein
VKATWEYSKLAYKTMVHALSYLTKISMARALKIVVKWGSGKKNLATVFKAQSVARSDCDDCKKAKTKYSSLAISCGSGKDPTHDNATGASTYEVVKIQAD